MLVDVLHGHRHKVGAFSDAGAELGHHQGVRAQVVEEVAVDRHTVDVQDVGENLGERRLGHRSRLGEFRPHGRIVNRRGGQDIVVAVRGDHLRDVG